MESLSPNIFVNDMNTTISFYKELGFTIAMNVPDEAPFVWVNMTNGKVSFMFQSWESLGTELPDIDRKANSGPLLFYINVKNIRSFFESIKNKVTVLKELEKTFYGATEFCIKDCNGLILTFAEHES